MNSPFTILIIEDELLIAEMLKEMLLELGYAVSGIAANYNSAKQLLENNKSVDLVILDINLNDKKTGVDIGREINENLKIPFIFLTSYSDKKTFSEAAQLMPEAYLIKPFTKTDLFATIELIKIRKLKTTRSLFIKDGHLNIKLNTDNILWLKSDNIYVEVKTADKNYLVRNSLDKLLEETGDPSLLRIHRSYAANVKHIQAVNGQYIIVQGEKLPVSRKFKDLITEAFKN